MSASITNIKYTIPSDECDYLPSVQLNEEFGIVLQPAKIVIPLFSYQKNMIKAMADLENSECLKVKGPQVENHTPIEYNLKFNAGILSNPVGSGKTIITLGLIAHQDKPRRSENYTIKSNTNISTSNIFNEKFPPVVYQLTYSQVLKPSLIFVSNSVFKQWSLAISRHTLLNVYCVKYVRDVEKVMIMIKSGQINNYDIVLVRTGSLSRIVVPRQTELYEATRQQTPYIYTQFANMPYIMWPRVIIDDFDTTNLAKDNSHAAIPSMFTWFVSTTRKIIPINSDEVSICQFNPKNALSYFAYGYSPLHRITKNKILYTILNLKNSAEYLNNMIDVGKPTFWGYKFKNLNKKLNNIIHELNPEDKEILDLINADAISMAAERLKIKATTTSGIFEALLGDSYKNLQFYYKLKSFIKSQLDNRNAWIKHNPEIHPPYTRYSMNNAKKMESVVYVDSEERMVDLLNRLIDECDKQLNTSKKVLDRIKSNLTEGDCPTCAFNIKEDCDNKIIIYKCCSILTCYECYKSIIFKNQFYAKCIQCMENINIKDSVIIVDGEDLTIDAIIQDIDDNNFKENLKIETTVKTSIVRPRKLITNYTKYDAIVDIIRGRKDIPNKYVIDINIREVMIGKKELPDAPLDRIKTLVFAEFDETLSKVEKRLENENINFKRLIGSSDQINSLIEEFNDYNSPLKVLVISATKYCAGLNLQKATNLIVTHAIKNKEILSQIAGRIFRLGREYNGYFHITLYEEEYEEALHDGYLRTISDYIYEETTQDEVDN